MLAGRQRYDKLLDERSHIAVAYHGTFPFLDAEDRCRDFYRQVLTHLDLTCQPPVVFDITARQMHHLGGKHLASALHHLHSALGTAALAAASRRQEHIGIGKRRQQISARRHMHVFVFVDCDGDIAAFDKVVLGYEQYRHQHQCDDEKYTYGCPDGQ